MLKFGKIFGIRFFKSKIKNEIYMKKIICLFIVAMIATTKMSQAQSLGSNYRTGLGVKLEYWEGGAISIKHFVKPSAALEGLISFWRYGTQFTGLYEFHGPITGAPGLKWYIGPGGHIGFWSDRWKNDYPDRSVGAYFGLDGVLGLDYKFRGAPINLSLDIQPGFDIPYGYFYVAGGLGIRFTF